jgi:hypothetical protein
MWTPVIPEQSVQRALHEHGCFLRQGIGAGWPLGQAGLLPR